MGWAGAIAGITAIALLLLRRFYARPRINPKASKALEIMHDTDAALQRDHEALARKDTDFLVEHDDRLSADLDGLEQVRKKRDRKKAKQKKRR